MRKQTPHSVMQDASNFIFIAFLILILAMALNSCATYRGAGSKKHAGMSGY